MPKLISCPKCGIFDSSIKYGRTKNKSQRYMCKDCRTTFILDGSPTRYLQSRNYLLIKFIGYMIDDVSLEVAARNLKINIKTAHYYRYLIFHSLSDYQSQVRLSGSILIDETFIRIREKKYKILRPDGKNTRGLSFNQLCVITLINLQGICVAKVSSRAMALPNDYIRLFNENIGKVKAFIHDGNPKQLQFMKCFDCELINGRKDLTGEYSTNLVDSLHSNLKRYLFKHAGYRLKHLQFYLDFFVYRYNFLSTSNQKSRTKIIKVKNDMIQDLFSRVKTVQKTIDYKSYLKDQGITKILESRK